jgi:uncharacterized protein (DUF2126 family)/transglutaminase-like putative cysteine protease
MAIHVALTHRTSYRYDRLVTLSPQIVRLRPAPHSRIPVLSYSMAVHPKPHFVNWQQDPHANYQARVVFPERVREFSVTIDLVAEMAVFNPFDFFLEPEAETFPFAYDADLAEDLKPFLKPLPSGPLLTRYLAGIDRKEMRTIDFLVGLNQRLAADIRYLIRMEPGVQTPEETLGAAAGSCRDSSWLLVQIFRHLGLAARFCSGYLIQLTPDEKPVVGPAGTSVDFTDLHAWAEVYLPGAGWIGLDPTSGLLTGEGHIPLACTPEPRSAAPITGMVEKAEVEFGFEMTIRRVVETPRVTKPYEEASWERLKEFGEKVDEALVADDVRLTMGGEPTFVSVEDRDAGEWNIDAVGPTKRIYADKLLKRLKNRYAPGGLLHYGQGKWYPGESLPRWAFTCFWRRDGVPLWRDPALIADEAPTAGSPAPNADAGHALRFITLLAEKLALADPHVLPAFEDHFYWLWKERRLPVNLPANDPRLADEEERARLMRVFDRGLENVVGYVMPLGHLEGGWRSGPWFLRTDHIQLIPGDSPIGLRLPIDSLPWVAPIDYPIDPPADPFEPRAPLSRQRAQPRTAAGRTAPRIVNKPKAGESAKEIVRTALAVEPRGGILHVFLPPIARLEAFIELIAAIEAAASDMRTPIRLEGYLPPRDPRLASFSVTPDPGVIEVNIQPTRSWSELASLSEDLYEDARQLGLGTEKFMIDGRHVGTGGGNHVTIGGSTAADSPILRRPDLLRSLLTCWHNHPSLSYLFSGMFIGPTSQAPRTDEARDDLLYELEIAFAELERLSGDGQACPPWLVDRLFRNLLTDVTGNTHRAEFCIDKLYSPDSATGRLGLLELRAFEMPPNARMALAQFVLLRALIARFWKTPDKRPLTRWGTDLHDRFMLPHFVEADFHDLLTEMAEAGWPLEPGWFDPHLEFRFPKIGAIKVHDMEIELRGALEPWHVLGEESAQGGVARYVDSSVERLQVKVTGMQPDRWAIACNRRRLPLAATGTVGEHVAGVRYKAWAPPSALHPTIGVHAPLVFDVIDLWSGRAVAGCTYHVSHPGGVNYTTLPVNAFEAESRRLSRFFAEGHSAEPYVPARAINPTFPLTLDLRRGS